MSLAPEIAAHEVRDLTATACADLQRQDVPRQPLAKRLSAVDKLRGRAVRDGMRIAMGKDDDVACRYGDIR